MQRAPWEQVLPPHRIPRGSGSGSASTMQPNAVNARPKVIPRVVRAPKANPRVQRRASTSRSVAVRGDEKASLAANDDCRTRRPMSPAIVALCALFAYAVAYRFYGRFLAQRVFRLDPARPTPAHTLRDEVDYVPTRPAI